ncbi:MAG: hypothetical protein IKP64_10980 [Selenomonadaceae bacterium]|nr:hypothetical protein [Selenomonadaceae bacterium]MBR4384065.1 hypothetical protein [Selenomonadaceae bacterium]
MNFFVTGNEIFKTGIDLKFIASTKSHGANFSFGGQTLSESLSIAQEIFGRVKRGKIDFVLIGLAPDALFQGENVDENLNALTEYIKLCIDNEAKPAAVIFPVAPSVRDRCRKNFVEPLRSILAELKKMYDFELVDLFDFPLADGYFDGEFCLTEMGKLFAGCALGLKLHETILPFENLCNMTYAFFQVISRTFSQKYFNDVMRRVFAESAKKISRKDKIKIGFSLWDTSMWCGDKLYKLFADDPRFEPTVFLYMEAANENELKQRDFAQGIRKFKAAGLNVVPVVEGETVIPKQDVLIFLIPYPNWYPDDFQTTVLTAETLVTYIPYTFEISLADMYKWPIYEIGWKIFFDTDWNRQLGALNCVTGGANFYYSGYPKVDIFADAEKISFPWKMICPDAKKIIWAPHWTIMNPLKPSEYAYANFQYVYRFLYEFAKTHPETSWVVKPHPKLLTAAVESGVFPSVEAFEEYIQAWNDLPNAQFFTGGYYQEIFATSDGMIHDSCSFIAEYQYTRKPMIYLTRQEQHFNIVGKRILEAAYCIDGRDLDGIAALMQKIFIDGDDPLKDERQKVFDEILNYRRVNGMSASEFIFHAIADELTGEQ